MVPLISNLPCILQRVEASQIAFVHLAVGTVSVACEDSL